MPLAHDGWNREAEYLDVKAIDMTAVAASSVGAF
jgi:hypothetical protein